MSIVQISILLYQTLLACCHFGNEAFISVAVFYHYNNICNKTIPTVATKFSKLNIHGTEIGSKPEFAPQTKPNIINSGINQIFVRMHKNLFNWQQTMMKLEKKQQK
eukprot:TRINITY_DN2434_c0_g1_i2.p2 TRINITY_DN2434_c0_g1~~TRINITY_DN2434_c0_g1_i2.p2  ORF type:complete len:106 (+),score=2.96 TRINITY_DN2434_c0_g1_i2:111-428(+)